MATTPPPGTRPPSIPGRTLSGLVLAAGAGSRLGMPKALVLDESGRPWLESAVDLLQGAGCDDVTVVLGAAADEARAFVPAGALAIVAPDWADGQAASLRAGLTAIAARRPASDAALITLVDLPGLPLSVAERVVGAGIGDGFGTSTLRQASFGGRPGHPVLIGRDHWRDLVSGLSGDRGARPYLLAHGATEVECGDLASGVDVDTLPG